jgi:hypothetical protein
MSHQSAHRSLSAESESKYLHEHSIIGKWLLVTSLILSLLFMGAISILVYGWWFPVPYDRISGGLVLLMWMVGIDIVCGPFIGWLLLKPYKSRKALLIDGTLIFFLQLTAFVYGIYTMAHARPLAIVFEVDRFRVVSHADVPESELSTAPPWFNPWGLQKQHWIGVREVHDLDEKIASVAAALQGVDAALYPTRWQDYSLNSEQVLFRARPLEELRRHYPLNQKMIDSVLQKINAAPEKIVWLPLTSRNSSSWVVLIEPTQMNVVGYLPLDGFF